MKKCFFLTENRNLIDKCRKASDNHVSDRTGVARQKSQSFVREKRFEPRSRKLQFELLEDRRLLTSIISDADYQSICTKYTDFELPESLNDINIIEIAADNLSVSNLKAAIMEAGTTAKSDLIILRTNDTANKIVFTNTSDEISIDINSSSQGKLSIIGFGTRSLTIDANNLALAMGIYMTNTEVNLGNLTISKGATTYAGGGIFNRGMLKMTGCTISNNISDSSGGGIYSSSGSVLTMTGCTISGNSSSSGGGIYSSGKLTMNNGSVLNNTSTNNGGGIYSSSNSELTMTDCIISRNTTDNNGGGIYSYSSSELTMTDCTLFGNSAGYKGGGIYFDSHNGTLVNLNYSFNIAWNAGNNIYDTGTAGQSVSYPVGIGVDSKDRTIVSDPVNNKVIVYDTNEQEVVSFGEKGTGSGQFNTPMDIAVDLNDLYYIVDYGNSRIQVFNSSGVFKYTFGGEGNTIGKFYLPEGICYDRLSDRIYVADTGNNRIQCFYRNGAIDANFGTNGCIGGLEIKRNNIGFDEPSDIAVNPVDGTIWIADRGNCRLQVYTQSGQYLKTILSVYHPQSLQFDQDGNLYIAGHDENVQPAMNGRIRILSKNASFAQTHFWGGVDDIGSFTSGLALKSDGTVLFYDVDNARLVSNKAIVQNNGDLVFNDHVTDFSIENRGEQITFRWKTAKPSETTIYYKYADVNDKAKLVYDEILRTEHEVTITELTPMTRLSYQIGYRNSFGHEIYWASRDTINTGVSTGQKLVQRINAVGLVYMDTKAGTGYIPISEEEAVIRENRFYRMAEYYWQNSGFNLWVDFQVIRVTRDITETDPLWLWSLADTELTSLGFDAGDNITGLWACGELFNGNYGGSGNVFGRTAGMAHWSAQGDEYALHEMNHSMDYIYNQFGIKKYESNHSLWSVKNAVGDYASVNGKIAGNLYPANYATLSPDTRETDWLIVQDTDEDGIPDSSPTGLKCAFAITEETLGTSSRSLDTDNDGLTDFYEATYFPFDRLDPLSKDTDGDGLTDALDLNPAYPITNTIAQKTPVIDGTISNTEGWTTFTEQWGYDNDSYMRLFYNDNNEHASALKTYLSWDENYFYVAVDYTGWRGVEMLIDGSADNWSLGTDQFRLNLNSWESTPLIAARIASPDMSFMADGGDGFNGIYDSDSEFTQPYQGRNTNISSEEGFGYSERLITETDLLFHKTSLNNYRIIWEVAIPWSPDILDFDGYMSKIIGLNITASGDVVFNIDRYGLVCLGDKNGNIPISEIVLSTENPSVGKTVSTTTFPVGVVPSYQWYRGTSASQITERITDATGSSYTPVIEDNGCFLKVVATYNGISCFASTTTSVSKYNLEDYTKIRSFLEITDSNGLKNGEKINENTYNSLDPTTFNVVWDDVDGEFRVTNIEWNEMGLVGNLDLSDCTSLENFYCYNNSLSGLNLSNCTSLRILWCVFNCLVTLNTTGCEQLVHIDCSFNNISRLDVSSNTALQGFFCSNNKLNYLDLSHCISLLYIGCWNSDLRDIILPDTAGMEYMPVIDLERVDSDWEPIEMTYSWKYYDNTVLSIDSSLNADNVEYSIEFPMWCSISTPETGELYQTIAIHSFNGTAITRTVQEGCALYIDASSFLSNSAGLAYEWDIDGDGIFGDVTGCQTWLGPQEIKRSGGEIRPVYVKTLSGNTLQNITTIMIVVQEVAPSICVKQSLLANDQVLLLDMNAFYYSRSAQEWIVDWGDGSDPSDYRLLSHSLKTVHFYERRNESKTYSVTLRLIDTNGNGGNISYYLISHTVSGTTQYQTATYSLEERVSSENVESTANLDLAKNAVLMESKTLKALPVWDNSKTSIVALSMFPDSNHLFLGTRSSSLQVIESNRAAQQQTGRYSQPLPIAIPFDKDLVRSVFDFDSIWENEDFDFVNEENIAKYNTSSFQEGFENERNVFDDDLLTLLL